MHLEPARTVPKWSSTGLNTYFADEDLYLWSETRRKILTYTATRMLVYGTVVSVLAIQFA